MALVFISKEEKPGSARMNSGCSIIMCHQYSSLTLHLVALQKSEFTTINSDQFQIPPAASPDI